MDFKRRVISELKLIESVSKSVVQDYPEFDYIVVKAVISICLAREMVLQFDQTSGDMFKRRNNVLYGFKDLITTAINNRLYDKDSFDLIQILEGLVPEMDADEVKQRVCRIVEKLSKKELPVINSDVK